MNGDQQIISKSFFGKSSCLVVQQTQAQDIYFRVGKKEIKGWHWSVAKLKAVEVAEIIALLHLRTEVCRFYHTYKNNEQHIFVNRKAEKVFVRIGEQAKPLDLGEQELLRIILETFLANCYDLVLSCEKGERRDRR